MRFNNFLTLEFGKSNKKSYISSVIRVDTLQILIVIYDKNTKKDSLFRYGWGIG